MFDGILMKVALAVLVVLLGGVFFWQPLQATFSGTTVTNDFVLQTADGAVDTRQLRGKVLALVFGSANCGAACAQRIAKTTQAYDMLSAAERAQVKLILVTVDPQRDTPARIGDYARGIHRDLTGATGKAEEIKAVTDAFSADFHRFELAGGDYGVTASALTYVIAPDGRFVSVLHETVPPEKIAAALRARLPALLPPR